ncbi:MAG TPA: hypothetical protein VIH86_05840, partial [Puia sp.]
MNKIEINSIFWVFGFAVLSYLAIVNVFTLVYFDESILLVFTIMIAFGFVGNILFPIINTVIGQRIGTLTTILNIMVNLKMVYYSELLNTMFFPVSCIEFARNNVLIEIAEFANFEAVQNERFFQRIEDEVLQSFEVFIDVFVDVARVIVHENIFNQFSSFGLIIFP